MDKEDFKYIISRYDHYFESANQKGNFLLGFNAFLITATVVSLMSFDHPVVEQWLKIPLFVCCLIILLISTSSIIFTLMSIYPFMDKTSNSEEYFSLLSFIEVSGYDENSYVNCAKNDKDNRLLEDYMRQSHKLANGLKIKYNLLKNAGRFIYIGIGFFVLYGILTLITIL